MDFWDFLWKILFSKVKTFYKRLFTRYKKFENS